MARSRSIDLESYGVETAKDEFVDQMCEQFNNIFRGQITVDELLLRPRQALKFCEDVREFYGYYDVPDEVILRVILQRRKNPNA